MTQAEVERAAIVAWLRGGGDHDTKMQWRSWDNEMRGYAAAFADMIESQRHRSKK